MVAYSYKRRFVTPIRVGLGLPIRPEDQDHDAATLLLPKRQTIRAHGLRRHARAGEELQHYCGMRQPGCFLIGRSICASVSDISIMVRKASLRINLVDPVQLDDFAQADGFASAEDMHEFWRVEHGLGKFEGVLVRWEESNGDEEATAPQATRQKHRRTRSSA